MSNYEGEEVRRREEAKRLRDEEASRLAGEEKRAAVAEEEKPSQDELAKRVKLLEDALAESESLRNGTYFANIDQVWYCAESDRSIDIERFNALIRAEAPIFIGRGESVAIYAKTKEYAMDEEFVAADDKTTRSNVSAATVIGIWPTDIFGNLPQAQIAHLIPASCKNATLFFDVVMWALGFPMNKDWNTLQRAIHGVKPKEGGIRVLHTGIKHSVSNKICLAGQYEFFDQYPCVLIIPIMKLQDMKDWKGEGYSALVMCGSKGVPATGNYFPASEVCRSIGMTNRGRIALDEEIKKARQLLEDVILGMAYSLLNCFKKREQLLDDAAKDLFNSFVNATRNKKVIVPVARPADSPESAEHLKVQVVEFCSHVVMEGHPAPDPLLLAVKAAINWSRRHHQPLRAAGEPPEERDELDVLAEEQFLEWRSNLHRPKTWEDLACGLGQPSGYQGTV